MIHNHSLTSRPVNNRRLVLIFLAAGLLFSFTGRLYAHQAPTTIALLDISPGKANLELQLPIPELELAFGNDISKDPATIIDRFGPQLKEYLKAHIHAYTKRDAPWQVEVSSLRMDKGYYPENGFPYWELIAEVEMKPNAGESTRKFLLDYDVIMHQVINHLAFVSVRNDWEAGTTDGPPAEMGVISWNLKDNVIYPLEINLSKKGSWFTGFRSMVGLGMKHIKEGTDHLLFLLVLLLPSMLLMNGKRWGAFGGTRYSVGRLFKIVTAFTIGHSITLLIGSLGWLHISPQPIEVLIAVSILISAIHAVTPVFYGKETFLAGGFGLIHGMAFASVLSDLHLAPAAMALTILGFNTGIELMQLLVVLLIVPWLIILSKTCLYDSVRITGAALAAVAALGWILERLSGKANFISRFIQNNAILLYWLIPALAVFSVVGYCFFKVKKQKSFSVLKAIAR